MKNLKIIMIVIALIIISCQNYNSEEPVLDQSNRFLDLETDIDYKIKISYNDMNLKIESISYNNESKRKIDTIIDNDFNLEFEAKLSQLNENEVEFKFYDVIAPTADEIYNILNIKFVDGKYDFDYISYEAPRGNATSNSTYYRFDTLKISSKIIEDGFKSIDSIYFNLDINELDLNKIVYQSESRDGYAVNSGYYFLKLIDFDLNSNSSINFLIVANG